MSARWTIVPDPRFAELQEPLRERVALAANSVQPDNFASLLDPLAQEILRQGFKQAGADEGTVWLLDSEAKHLVPAYNSGPHAAKMIAQFKQPLNAGLISMVFASEQPIVENEVFKNARQSKLLDELLQVQTHGLIAVPFHFLKGCRGVVSCVQLKKPARQFEFADLGSIQRTAALLSQLIELRLLSTAVGWTS